MMSGNWIDTVRPTWFFVVAALLAPWGVLAQQSVANDEDDDANPPVEEIVIYGTRLILNNYIDTKRNSTDIVDSLGEDELATLPAINAAEVISSLSGVATFTDGFGAEAGERGGGVVQPTTLEARFASLRGIRGDLNLTQLDGMNLAIPNQSGRTNFLDWFPVNLAKRIEVRKTFNAEQDGNAIGGIVNIVTRSGFDYDAPFTNIGASLSRDELRDGQQPYDQPFNFQATYAAPISERFAIAATANYNRRDFFFPHRNNEARRYFNDEGAGVSIGFNHPVGQNLGNGVAVPIANRLNSSSTETDRYGGAFRLDFRPVDQTDIWLNSTISILDQNVFGTENDMRQPLFCFSFFGCSLSAVEQTGGATGVGVIDIKAAESIFSDSLSSENDSKLGSVIAGLDHRFDDDWTLELRFAASKASQEQFDLGFFFAVPAEDAAMTWRYDFSDPASPIINVDEPDRIFNPSLYRLLRANELGLDLSEDNRDMKLNFAYNADDDDSGLGFKWGVRRKNVDREFSEYRLQFNASASGQQRFGLDQVLSPVSGQDLDIPHPGNLRTLLQDTDAALALIGPNLQNSELFTRHVLSDAINDYRIEEKTAAAFFYARYVTDRLTANAGLRYESTEHIAHGVVLDSIAGTIADGTAGGKFRPKATSGKMDYWLPSLQLVYELRENLIFRVAYSESLGRPGYNSLAPQGDTFFTNINLESPETVARTIVNATGSRRIANPDLKPRQSDNYDMSLEWYLDDGSGLISVGFFKKDIHDEIFTATSTGTETINVPTVAEPVPVLITTETVRNTNEASLNGVEMNFVRSLEFLPLPVLRNAGVNVNATFIDGDFKDLARIPIGGDSPVSPGFLPGQPERLYNVTFYYSTAEWDVNVGLNHVGKMNTYFNSAESFGAGQDVFNEERSTINAGLSYRMNDNLQIFFEANNITGEEVVRFSGEPSLQSIRRRFATGMTLALGANISLNFD